MRAADVGQAFQPAAGLLPGAPRESAAAAPKGRPTESGFALLLVYLMAAMIALAMYLEIPRVALESERNKEQLLIERGEQYKRAIQVFVRKDGRFPGKIEDLENFNNVRFLRKRYKDPMTGKEEWRFIHCGPGGALIDSVTHKPAQKQDQKETTQAAATDGSAATGDPNAQQQGSLALRRRASDMPGAPGSVAAPDAAGNPAMPSDPNQPVPGDTTNPNDQAGLAPGMEPNPAQPGDPAAQPGVAGIQPGMAGMQPGAAGTQPGSTPFQPGMAPMQPGVVPVQPGANGQPGAQFTPGGAFIGGTPRISGSLVPQTIVPVPAGTSAPGTPGPTDAARLIQQILTTPRQGGMPAGVGGSTPGGPVIGGGIAGVASTSELDSIMLYDGRQKYNEWEFIYDLSKDRTNAGARQGGQMQGSGSSPNQPQIPAKPK